MVRCSGSGDEVSGLFAEVFGVGGWDRQLEALGAHPVDAEESACDVGVGGVAAASDAFRFGAVGAGTAVGSGDGEFPSVVFGVVGGTQVEVGLEESVPVEDEQGAVGVFGV